MTSLLPWSFTMINNYRNCAHKALHLHVLKDIPRVSSPELERGIYVHEALEARVAGTPLPEDLSQHDPIVQAYVDRGARAELMLGIKADGSPCDFFDPGVAGRGKLDIVIINKRGTRAFLADWKSGKIREDKTELLVQSLLLKAHYPDLIEIQGRYIWLSQLTEKMGMLHNVSDTTIIAKMIEDMLAEMQSYNAEWPKKPNPLCGWCNVTSCEHQAPAYERRLKKGK